MARPPAAEMPEGTRKSTPVVILPRGPGQRLPNATERLMAHVVKAVLLKTRE